MVEAMKLLMDSNDTSGSTEKDSFHFKQSEQYTGKRSIRTDLLIGGGGFIEGVSNHLNKAVDVNVKVMQALHDDVQDSRHL